jgi:hypothetical protein
MLSKKEFPSKSLNIQVLVVISISDLISLLYSICIFNFVVTIVIVQMCLAFKKSLQERSLDIGRALKSVTLGQSSLAKINVI